MADRIYEDPRLAQLYDALDSDRSDLDVYVEIVAELGARSVLDVGCGTGTFACLLASRGLDVVAVDPAAASLDVARAKPGADRVRWLHGDATALPDVLVDLAAMTGNVAQVFLTDEEWSATLRGVHAALRPGGYVLFETRDPANEAWREWNPADTYSRVDVPGKGVVESWLEVTDVSGELVTFRGTIVFEADGTSYTSDSTLRFRGRGEVERSLTAAGFVIDEVRDAPDRPGRELVFLSRRSPDV